MGRVTKSPTPYDPDDPAEQARSAELRRRVKELQDAYNDEPGSDETALVHTITFRPLSLTDYHFKLAQECVYLRTRVKNIANGFPDAEIKEATPKEVEHLIASYFVFKFLKVGDAVWTPPDRSGTYYAFREYEETLGRFLQWLVVALYQQLGGQEELEAKRRLGGLERPMSKKMQKEVSEGVAQSLQRRKEKLNGKQREAGVHPAESQAGAGASGRGSESGAEGQHRELQSPENERSGPANRSAADPATGVGNEREATVRGATGVSAGAEASRRVDLPPDAQRSAAGADAARSRKEEVVTYTSDEPF